MCIRDRYNLIINNDDKELFFSLKQQTNVEQFRDKFNHLEKKAFFPLLCNFLDAINKIESTGAVFAGLEQETFDKVRNEYLPC